MQEWFDEWDVDGNECISKNELAEGLQKLGVFLSEVSGFDAPRDAQQAQVRRMDLDNIRVKLATPHARGPGNQAQMGA